MTQQHCNVSTHAPLLPQLTKSVIKLCCVFPRVVGKVDVQVIIKVYGPLLTRCSFLHMFISITSLLKFATLVTNNL